MPNPPTPKMALEQRVRSSYRARACAAGLCVGAQIFLAGCAIGMPLSLGGAWLASLPAVLLAVWITGRCRNMLVSSGQNASKSRLYNLLLCAALLLSGAFAAASMVCFAGQTLIEQTRGIWTSALTAAAAALCALSGSTGAARLCFALRYALPAVLLGLSLSDMPMRIPAGLFPILGAGAPQLGMASLGMLFAAAPALMLALPPPEITLAGDAAQACALPDKRFFVQRVLCGALIGAVLLLLSCGAAPYESIEDSTQWGARLSITAGASAHEGVLQMLLTLFKLLAMLLLAANMLCAVEQALVLAFPSLSRNRSGLVLLLLVLFFCLAALIILGERPLLLLAPGIAVPAVLAAWIAGRRNRA